MIVFTRIKYKNFLSIGNNFVEIDLAKNHSTMLYGPSGSGKSTLLDAITFVLYGKAYRGINKGNLVNSINQKDCVVEINFTINENNYFIRRGIKPNIFEIYVNDELLQQSNVKDYQKYLEDYILKIDVNTFTQIVVLGPANFVPFLSLKAAERRAFIESILDLQIFSEMNALLKNDINDLKNNIRENSFNIELLKNKIETHKAYLKKLTEDKSQIINENKETIKKYENNVNQLKEECNKIDNVLAQYKVKDTSEIENKINNLRKEINGAKASNKVLENSIAFFEKNKDICPSCLQHIEHTHSEKYLDEFRLKITNYNNIIDESNKKIDELNEEFEKIILYNNKLEDLESKRKNLLYQITTTNNIIEDLNTKISNLLLEAKIDNKLDEYTSQLENLCAKQIEYSKNISLYNTCTELLKDSGIKQSILSLYIPLLNKYLAEELENMGIYYSVKFDNEFNEVINNCAINYEAYSAGEAQRFDLAFVLAIRELLIHKAKATTNLFIIDEVLDSYLDADTSKLVVDSLIFNKNLLESTNIFIISHKSYYMFPNIDSVLLFNKSSNFTKISNQAIL